MPGRDLAVIGFRESPSRRFLSPALTCFRMSLRDLGIGLAESLLASCRPTPTTYPHGVVNKIWPMELVAGRERPARPVRVSLISLNGPTVTVILPFENGRNV